jgi:hypothetical protein
MERILKMIYIQTLTITKKDIITQRYLDNALLRIKWDIRGRAK